MELDLNVFKELLTSLSSDERINPWHVAIMFAIVQLAHVNDISEAIFVSRKKIMKLAHVGSIATYHKCIKELQGFGYIRYVPSYHPGIRSTMSLQCGLLTIG